MLGTLDLENAAQQAAGNWRQYASFAWFRRSEIEDAEKWAIVYTHNRDSGLLDQSNASVISKAMAPFADADDPTVVFESHNHWAVGHVDGFSIRVFDGIGEITEAFQKYHELAERLDDYPILDESDYSDREYRATLENIGDAAWRLKGEFTLPEGWASQMYDWLSDHRPGENQSRDDRGGYPSEDGLKAAFKALGFKNHD